MQVKDNNAPAFPHGPMGDSMTFEDAHYDKRAFIAYTQADAMIEARKQ